MEESVSEVRGETALYKWQREKRRKPCAVLVDFHLSYFVWSVVCPPQSTGLKSPLLPSVQLFRPECVCLSPSSECGSIGGCGRRLSL